MRNPKNDICDNDTKQNLDKQLISCAKTQTIFQTLFILLCHIFYTGVRVVFPYPGSKQKMKDELNYVFEKLYLDKLHKTGTGYTTFIDGFVGGMNSTFVLMDSLILSNVKKIIINDINPCIVQVHYDIRNNAEELIKEFSEIIRTNFIIPHGSIIVDIEICESINSKLNEEFMQLQKNEDFGVKSSIRFMFLLGSMYSGIPKYDKSKDAQMTDFKFTSKIYDIKRYYGMLFNQIPKIYEFNKLYNQIDIEFRSQDFFILLEEFKNNPDVLFNLDVPYIKNGDTNKEYTLEELEKMTSKELDDCVINYNLEFNHVKMLKELKNINFIYNNNNHPILDFYAKKISAQMDYYQRAEVTSSKANEKTKRVLEYIIYKNSTLD